MARTKFYEWKEKNMPILEEWERRFKNSDNISKIVLPDKFDINTAETDLKEAVKFFKHPDDFERLMHVERDNKLLAIGILSRKVDEKDTIQTLLIAEGSNKLRRRIYEFYDDFHNKEGTEDRFLSENRESLILPLMQCGNSEIRDMIKERVKEDTVRKIKEDARKWEALHNTNRK